MHCQRWQVQKTFNEKRIISKVHPFLDGIFKNKNLFIFREYIFFKANKPRECIGSDVVFARDKVNIRVELFDIIEPANNTVRSSIVSCNVKVISVYVEHCSKKHGAKFG